MATVSLSTSPTTLDSGTSEFVTVVNVGTVDVTVTRGPQAFTLRPGQSRTVYPEGAAVTAVTTSGTGSVTTTAQGARQTQAQQFAADPAFTGTYARNTVSAYVPAGWGAIWQAARAVSGSSLARVAIVGDSIAQGYNCSNPQTKAWPSLLRSAVQSTYGDGGSGYLAASYSDSFITATVGSGFTTAYNTAGVIYTTSGTWTRTPIGVGNQALQSTVAGSTIASPPLRGTSIDIYTIDGFPAGTWTYAVDGGSAVTVTPGAGNVTVKRTITGLSAGTHTVVITYTGATNPIYFCGLRAYNATGVVVDNYSRYGATSSNFTESYGLGWHGGSKNPADLMIVTLGVNDANGGIAGAAFAQNIRKILDDAKQGTGTTGATDIAFVVQHIGKQDNAAPQFQDIAGYTRDLAATYGAALVNTWAAGRNSWTYWNSLGYWGNNSASGVAGTENVHLSDAGQAGMYAAITAAVPGLLAA